MNNFQQEPNTTQKILACLSYISYFFLPVIFPLIVWIVSADNPFVKRHAKRAFWSQLLPAVCTLVFIMLVGIGASFNFSNISWGWMSITLIAIVCLIALGSLIYNVAGAIRVLLK
ncbi:MAG: DUF4870 domain-containing protein [Candidatus Limosilactobacillus intestinavium]